MVRTALRSVVLALVFITGVSLYAFRNLFRRLEALEGAYESHRTNLTAHESNFLGRR